MSNARVLLLRGAIGSGKTSAAEWIKTRYPEIAVIEVDDIKLQKYGTTERCEPEEDFPEAGRHAKDALATGREAILVEAFCEREHLRLVLGASGLTLSSPNVSVVWLECSLDTSLKRKGDSVPPDMIRFQHRRYRDRFRVAGEHVIHTDAINTPEVALRLLNILQADQRGASG